MNPILSVKNLNIAVKGVELVKDVSFDVMPKEIVALIGPNGAGKTTTLKAVLDLIPYEGDISVCGNKNHSRVKHIGYVPQRFVFDKNFPLLVREFIKMTTAVSDKEIEGVLSVIDISGLLDKRIGDLSGGELQKVMLAKAVILHPCLILLDEATTGIDPKGVKEFAELVNKVRDEYATSIVFVSHEIDLVYRFADKVVAINKEIISIGSPEELLNSEKMEDIYTSSHLKETNRHGHAHSIHHNHG